MFFIFCLLHLLCHSFLEDRFVQIRSFYKAPLCKVLKVAHLKALQFMNNLLKIISDCWRDNSE